MICLGSNLGTKALIVNKIGDRGKQKSAWMSMFSHCMYHFFFLLLSCGMCSICYFSLAGDVKTGTPQLLTLQLMEDLPNPETFLSVAKDGSCVVLLVLLNHLILFLLKHCGRYYKLLILAYIFMFICNFKQMLSLLAFLEM